MALSARFGTIPDFLSVSAHKVFGPKGIGALYARRRGSQKRPLSALLFGGGQELGLRPGTLPVPLVIGLGAAAQIAGREYRARREAAHRLKERFLENLASVRFELNGDQTRTQAHVVNISFPDVDSEALMMAMRSEIAISNGAACTSSSYAPSHVLKAMGLSDERIASSVRISWGPGIIELPARQIVDAVEGLQK